MNLNLFTLIVFLTFFRDVFSKMRYKSDSRKYNLMMDHTLVTDNNVFPYVVAILKKFSYMSSGALINDKWVLTAADALFLVRESTRIIRVRLGSINYKKGGILLPVKTVEVHPFFDDSKPVFDIALIMLARSVRYTPNLHPVRMQYKPKEVTATHFIVTAWTPSLRLTSKESRHLVSMDMIKQRRMLSVSHLHPADASQCSELLSTMEINITNTVICLDPDVKADPCWRDTGAPVVLNGILWGVVSSWRPDDCYLEAGASFAALVAAGDIKTWIQATTAGQIWNRTSYENIIVIDDDSNEI